MSKSTTDIGLAAALLSLGAKLEKTNKEDPRHMVFTFSSPKVPVVASGTNIGNNTSTITVTEKDLVDLEAVENGWVNETLMVNAFKFSESLKRLKSIVHSH